MAEPKKSIGIQRSKALFETANQYIPGGVNSPARAFRSVGGNPLFIRKAAGAYLYDEDGNTFIDLINSWGPMILGHAQPDIMASAAEALQYSSSFGAPTEVEIEMARLVTDLIPSVGKVRMVNSGTEATMSAIRLARGYTGKDKFIKFEGCYHGHGDSFLIAAGSGLVTLGIPDSPGVTKGTAKDTLLARFNDLEQVKELAAQNKGEIAAIILEPVAGNMGLVKPEPGFLEGLRALCDAEGIVLIFDEVMTGFRLSLGGAQELLGVRPDLTCLGKIIGGGMPVGAYGGKSEIMDYVSPAGPIYQAGTLSGNPVAMHAGLTMLQLLRDNPAFYTQIEATTNTLATGMQERFEAAGVPICINHIGSMITFFMQEGPVINFDDSKKSDLEMFGAFFRAMLNRGVYFPPSQFEALFVSTCITEKEVAHILDAAEESLKSL
ncbi:UNVERIFIED_CONTAM: hypothetical protein GTU68_029092 [Idotea baltica]|nr:hypothetical protein [Idotea baltica]